ncbi:hypothetical protein [Propionispora sp. 2/2-37]|uniref:Y-family DNA polymerase n=1 Tax=Propionispora sp. 2/2-37 TaxID=1677858 RepID=UPI003592E805
MSLEILDKNYPAKEAGIKTGEAIWEARQKCPGLALVLQTFVNIYGSQEWPEQFIRSIPIR